MSKSPSRRFPVTVTQLPVTRCQICQRTVAYRPGSLSEVLTGHYRRAHPRPIPKRSGSLPSSPPQAARITLRVPSPAAIVPGEFA